MKKEIVLELKRQHKINYESYDKFSESHFFNVYREAASMVKDILKENKKFYEGGRTGNDARNQEQIYNVLSFVGKRGSGKSSSMLSFAEFLRDYGRIGPNMQEEDFKLLDQNKLFTVVDSIDASILADNEEIFEIILARMLAKFMELDEKELLKEGDYEFKRRELYVQFEKMYKRINFFKVKEKSTNIDSDMPLEKLRELSATYNVKKEFSKLVKEYIELVRYKDFHRKEFDRKDCYIVIVIDDIDMNIRRCYEMLEEIHRYLLIPNVIILISYEPEFIEQVCEMHYLSELKNLEKNQKYRDDLSRVAQPLTRDYLEKMLDYDKRIHMPYLPEEMGNIRIIGDEERQESLEVKKAIFQKLYERLRTVFYYGSEENHILEPLTLRELSNFYSALTNHHAIDFELLSGMKAGDIEDIKRELKKYDENYKWFLQELIGRFSGGEREIQRKMEEVINSPYESRIVAAYSHLAQRTKEPLSDITVDYCRLIFEIVKILRNPYYTVNEKKYPELLTVYLTALFAYIDVHIKCADTCSRMLKNKGRRYKKEKEKWEKRERILKAGRYVGSTSVTQVIMGKVYDYNDPGESLRCGVIEHLKDTVSGEWNMPQELNFDTLYKEKTFKKAIGMLLKYLLFTNYYDLRIQHKKTLHIAGDTEQRAKVTIDEIEDMFFDISLFIWNFDGRDKIADSVTWEISRNLCEEFSETKEVMQKKLYGLLEKVSGDIKILSMPDVMVHMWKNNEKKDIEVNEVKGYLNQILKKWGNEISASLKYSGAWEDSKKRDFFSVFYKYTNEIFEFVAEKYRIVDTEEKYIIPPTDTL